jgi:hypothetical protein
VLKGELAVKLEFVEPEAEAEAVPVVVQPLAEENVEFVE